MIRIFSEKDTTADELFKRSYSEDDVSAPVRKIIADVAARGDKAVREYTERFDKVSLSSFEVSDGEFAQALEEADPKLIEIMKLAAQNIREYHSRQIRDDFSFSKGSGIILGQRIIPLERVGIYVPGGTAAYPSTVLMDTIPAKLAGVKEIIMVSPPGKDGKLPANVLAAAKIAGADRVFKIGGAQAIAALSYGTETVPAVDKIVGPGNAFVAEAKKQVFGKVAIDMVAGPSEILIVSDGSSDPRYIAADLLSQAEHDRLATAILITDSKELALNVQREIEVQLEELERKEIARASIDNNGKIIITESIEKSIEIANRTAPEHLELCVDDPFSLLEKVKNAGSVFLGRNCPEALGDYFAGPNHTLPTSGTARFSSPLSVDDFIKKTQFLYYSEEALRNDCEKVAAFAKAEGLTAHAKSAVIRNGEI